MGDVTIRSPLAQLVDDVCEANGWSRREVVRRAQQAGREISNSRLGQLVGEYPLRGIQTDKVDDLAIGLGISRDRVAVAVIQAMGFQVSDTTVTPAEAIRRDPTLSAHTKQALLAILHSTNPAGTRERRGGEHERSAPIGEPEEQPLPMAERRKRLAAAEQRLAIEIDRGGSPEMIAQRQRSVDSWRRSLDEPAAEDTNSETRGA